MVGRIDFIVLLRHTLAEKRILMRTRPPKMRYFG